MQSIWVVRTNWRSPSMSPSGGHLAMAQATTREPTVDPRPRYRSTDHPRQKRKCALYLHLLRAGDKFRLGSASVSFKWRKCKAAKIVVRVKFGTRIIVLTARYADTLPLYRHPFWAPNEGVDPPLSASHMHHTRQSNPGCKCWSRTRHQGAHMYETPVIGARGVYHASASPDG